MLEEFEGVSVRILAIWRRAIRQEETLQAHN